jgi:hypothetical protein
MKVKPLLQGEIIARVSNGGSRGLDEAMIGKTIFTCVHIKRISSPEPAGQFQSNLVQSIFW